MKTVCAVATMLLAFPVLADEPAMFLGDARHSGLVRAQGVPTLHGVKWKFKTNGRVISSPTHANGTLYFGSTDHYVYAVDAATGAQRWKAKTNGRVVSSAALADGLVFIESYDGNLYALDAQSGATRWTFKTSGERRFTAKHLHAGEPASELMADPFDFLSRHPPSNAVSCTSAAAMAMFTRSTRLPAP